MDKGEPGQKGNPGEDGLTIPGRRGYRGEKGEKGKDGIDGEKGEQGSVDNHKHDDLYSFLGHRHGILDLVDWEDSIYSKNNLREKGQASVHWDNLTNKPDLADKTHQHQVADIGDLDTHLSNSYHSKQKLAEKGQASVHWDNLTNKPELEEKGHQHSIDDITGLQTELDKVKGGGDSSGNEVHKDLEEIITGYKVFNNPDEEYIGALFSRYAAFGFGNDPSTGSRFRFKYDGGNTNRLVLDTFVNTYDEGNLGWFSRMMFPSRNSKQGQGNFIFNDSIVVNLPETALYEGFTSMLHMVDGNIKWTNGLNVNDKNKFDFFYSNGLDDNNKLTGSRVLLLDGPNSALVLNENGGQLKHGDAVIIDTNGKIDYSLLKNAPEASDRDSSKESISSIPFKHIDIGGSDKITLKTFSSNEPSGLVLNLSGMIRSDYDYSFLTSESFSLKHPNHADVKGSFTSSKILGEAKGVRATIHHRGNSLELEFTNIDSSYRYFGFEHGVILQYHELLK